MESVGLFSAPIRSSMVSYEFHTDSNHHIVHLSIAVSTLIPRETQQRFGLHVSWKPSFLSNMEVPDIDHPLRSIRCAPLR
jgi:hypothetical protein